MRPVNQGFGTTPETYYHRRRRSLNLYPPCLSGRFWTAWTLHVCLNQWWLCSIVDVLDRVIAD